MLCSCVCRHMRLHSAQHLNINFNPAALLSVGDALDFLNTLCSVDFNDPSFLRGVPTGQDTATVAPENAPELNEQMAQKGSITSRVPQKYLIQNQSGLCLYYWGEEVGRAADPYLSKTLAVFAPHVQCGIIQDWERSQHVLLSCLSPISKFP